MGGAHVTDDVDHDEGQDDGRQADPPQDVDVHVFSSGTELVPEVSSRHVHRRSRHVPLWPRRRERRTDGCPHRRDDDVAVGWEYSPPCITPESLTGCFLST